MQNSRRRRHLFRNIAVGQESEEILWLFLENVPAPVAMLNREMRYIIVSQRWLSDYRLKEQDVIGKSHYEVFPEIPERWKEIHRRCLSGSIERSEADPFLRQDGRIDWIRWEVRPWRDSSGTIGGIIMFTEVITEHKNAELALKELNITLENRVRDRTGELSEANRKIENQLYDLRQKSAELDAALDVMEDGVLIYGLDGRIQRMNRVAAETFELFGLAKDWTIEERLKTMSAEIDSGEVLSVEKFPPMRALRGEPSHRMLMRDQPSGKPPVWFLVSAAPLKTSDRGIIGAVATFVDITEQKRVEEKYRTILKTSMDGFWLMNARGEFHEVNDAFCQMMGYSRQELLKMSLRDVEAIETPDEILQHIALAIRQKEARFETQHRRKDGNLIDVEICTAVLEAEKSLLFVFSKDITEQKRIDRELREAIKSRDEFLSIASHELKTPLTALQLQLALLRRIAESFRVNEKESGRIIKLAAGAEEQILKLSRLLGNLLDLTRIRAGKFDVELRVVDLVQIVRNIISQVEVEASSSGSNISVKGDATVTGFWDPSRIEQVVQNLVSNAIKYGLGKPITIAIKSDASIGRVDLEVRDHGSGIAPELTERIFERFERVTTDHSIKGTGLGLYIVRQIVEAHGGMISVESAPGRGSVFKVTLPLRNEKLQVA